MTEKEEEKKRCGGKKSAREKKFPYKWRVKNNRKMSNERDVYKIQNTKQESKITLSNALWFFYSSCIVNSVQSTIVFRMYDFLRFGHLVFSIKFYGIDGKTTERTEITTGWDRARKRIINETRIYTNIELFHSVRSNCFEHMNWSLSISFRPFELFWRLLIHISIYRR